MDTEVERLPGDEQADDQSEEAEDRAEDFDNEDFDEAIRGGLVKRVSERVRKCNREHGAGLMGGEGGGRREGTHSEGSAASARAAPLPLIPTAIPQTRLQPPTVIPAQKRAKPVK